MAIHSGVYDKHLKYICNQIFAENTWNLFIPKNFTFTYNTLYLQDLIKDKVMSV